MFESLDKFESSGFKFRFLDKKDKSFFVSLYTCPEVMRYICQPFSKIEAELLFENKISEQVKYERNRYVWLVGDSVEPLGLVGLTKVDSLWDIGAILSLTCLGKGNGTRVMSALLAKVFEQYSLQRVVGTIPTVNIPCQKSVQKLGFEFSGKIKGGDNQIWYLERDNFKKGESRKFK
ncbi:GNAT family N-acetyltransferase [Kangiella koreensis]|uniref:GCN5-related N-acetyltransferase n=1 Tax=Kangiella koreensis (strain DSM 16069 / JCM 12317 / KCTC 12182 / SW-125) TaxID=523791 RepID=C7R803_KANKD|nr:GNAT family N-acetyltransferase [Kangiella koreensis]ACV25785.1 GCN5-related N-acetyltransferase [Kangiella koreensis DSM 16069]